MAGATVIVRNIFIENSSRSYTAGDINRAQPALKPAQISMALTYLLHSRYVTRELIQNPHNRGRKQVWSYTYHSSRVATIGDDNAVCA
jgi:hypothetical protein